MRAPAPGSSNAHCLPRSGPHPQRSRDRVFGQRCQLCLQRRCQLHLRHLLRCYRLQKRPAQRSYRRYQLRHLRPCRSRNVRLKRRHLLHWRLLGLPHPRTLRGWAEPPCLRRRHQRHHHSRHQRRTGRRLHSVQIFPWLHCCVLRQDFQRSTRRTSSVAAHRRACSLQPGIRNRSAANYASTTWEGALPRASVRAHTGRSAYLDMHQPTTNAGSV